MSTPLSAPPFLLVLSLAMAAQANAQTAPMPAASTLIQKGLYQPSINSLQQHRTPDWFRNAKFGIWSQWGVNSVPMMGESYPKNMYVEGSPEYLAHVEKFGHPSKVGYKDIIPAWKAENWNPDELMKLYANAGAKYFVSMAVDRDNFDLWNSKYQPKWNSVNMGPKRDIVGDWQKAAKKQGMPFGVSENLAASYTGWQSSHGADKYGSLAGVPYDGANAEYQDLYHASVEAEDADKEAKDPASQRDWFNRMKDLVDKYQPDLLYSEGFVPFPEKAGVPLIAHFYNSDLKSNNGRATAVYSSKQFNSEGGWVMDRERGAGNAIKPFAWQSDASIGDRVYRPNSEYKSADTVVQMLCDVVSKNGNLLLNVAQKPDGTIDPQSRAVLSEMAKWMPINGEAIFGTRPWLISGEGAPPVMGEVPVENRMQYTSEDVRFTTKNNALYALVLGWPKDKRVVIKALAQGSPGVLSNPKKVELLGYKGNLKWKRTANGLEVDLPMTAPSKGAVALKISGMKSPASLSAAAMTQWNNVLMPEPTMTVTANSAGMLYLSPEKATMQGDNIRITRDPATGSDINSWSQPTDWVLWDKVDLTKTGKYRVSAEVSSKSAGAQFTVKIGGQTVKGAAPVTGDWYKYQTVELGEVTLNQVGNMPVELRAITEGWRPINVKALRLTPIK